MNLAASTKLTNGDESEAALRLAQGAKTAKSDPALPTFFEAHYRNAAPEDINRYTPEALAALAGLVLGRVERRQKGGTLVDVFSPIGEDEAYGLSESVLVAINDDMPFLFDSLLGELNAQGARLRAVFHPIVKEDGGAISVIVAVLDPILDETRRKALVDGAAAVFAQVREAVRDWRAMAGKLDEAIAGLKKHPPRIPENELKENIAFLEWLSDNHFTFLGCRDYRYAQGAESRLDPVDKSGLGVLTDTGTKVLQRGTLTPQITASSSRSQRR